MNTLPQLVKSKRIIKAKKLDEKKAHKKIVKKGEQFNVWKRKDRVLKFIIIG